MPQLPVVFPAASVAGGRPAGAGSRFAVAYGQPGAGPGIDRLQLLDSCSKSAADSGGHDK